MENEDSGYYKNYSDYEFVSRKRRGQKGKQKKSQLPTLTIHKENGTEELDTETLDGTRLTMSENDDSQLIRNDVASNTNRISLDSLVSAQPDPNNFEDLLEEPNRPVNEVDKAQFLEDHQDVKEDFQRVKVQESINHRALSKYVKTYQLEEFEKKALLIFNQVTFDEKFKPRLGTEKDVEALTRTFTSFGFDVVEHRDLTKDEMFMELKEFSERDFTDCGCVAVAVLTHGSNNGLLRAKDSQYSEIEIINHFKVYDKPTLVTKPKVLIIQACRGTKIKQGVPVFHSGKIRKDHDEDLEPYILPVESDMLILHSSYVGSPSHRDEVKGSWFIQSLCDKIDQLAPTHDLESILTEVKREVAIDRSHEEYNRRTFEMDINKQMPVMTSTLIRKLYFRKFGEVAKDDTVTLSDKVCLDANKSSTNEVLDAALTPNTPLLVQFGPCMCFLDHFAYIRQCLSYYSAENPADTTALDFLEIANTFEEGLKYNTAKESMTKLICKHLLNNAKGESYFKYLYFYKHL